MIIYLLGSKLNATAKREWEKTLMVHLTSKRTLKGMIKLLEEHSMYLFKMNANKAFGNEIREIKPTKNYNSAPRERVRSYTVMVKPMQRSARIACVWRVWAIKCSSASTESKNCRFVSIAYRAVIVTRIAPFGSCWKCSKKHNTLLHLDPIMPRPQTSIPRDPIKIEGDSTLRKHWPVPAQITQSNYLAPRASRSNLAYVLLGTATVRILVKGRQHECRPLLNSCSQLHIMYVRFMEAFGPGSYKIRSHIHGHWTRIATRSLSNHGRTTLTYHRFFGKINLHSFG